MADRMSTLPHGMWIGADGTLMGEAKEPRGERRNGATVSRSLPRIDTLSHTVGFKKSKIIFTVVLAYLDWIFDGLVALEFWRAGHVWWAKVTCIFLVLTPLMLLLFKTTRVVAAVVTYWRTYGAPWKKVETPRPDEEGTPKPSSSTEAPAQEWPVSKWTLLSLLASLFNLDLLSASIRSWTQCRSHAWRVDPLQLEPEDTSLRAGISWSVEDLKFSSAVGSSLPQFLFQGYVLLVLRLSKAQNLSSTSFGVQATSMILSSLSLSVTVGIVRIGMQEINRTKSMVNVMFWTWAETSLRALSLAFFVAAFRMYLAIALCVVAAIKTAIAWRGLQGAGWDDKIIYVMLSMLVYFHIDGADGSSLTRHFMFTTDTITSLVFLALPLIEGLRVAEGNFFVPDTSLVIIGTCPEKMGTCKGFPPSYIINYCLLFTLQHVCYYLHETKYFERQRRGTTHASTNSMGTAVTTSMADVDLSNRNTCAQNWCCCVPKKFRGGSTNTVSTIAVGEGGRTSPQVSPERGVPIRMAVNGSADSVPGQVTSGGDLWGFDAMQAESKHDPRAAGVVPGVGEAKQADDAGSVASEAEEIVNMHAKLFHGHHETHGNVDHHEKLHHRHVKEQKKKRRVQRRGSLRRMRRRHSADQSSMEGSLTERSMYSIGEDKDSPVQMAREDEGVVEGEGEDGQEWWNDDYLDYDLGLPTDEELESLTASASAILDSPDAKTGAGAGAFDSGAGSGAGATGEEAV